MLYVVTLELLGSVLVGVQCHGSASRWVDSTSSTDSELELLGSSTTVYNRLTRAVPSLHLKRKDSGFDHSLNP